ncbi:43kDa postsynaptic protein [Parasponia andersonii]|uniref:RING-type E3 ubiquitin transferase n=1 Tax=Parasponia andersonii TaxID=3476 RepID=A0A2P5APF6_PARAD|nr:43kDa postsynaptic protein [Parasponia andersonii]
MSQEWPQSTAHSGVGSRLVVGHSVQAVCSLCQKILSPDNEATGDLETISICGDCKFLFLEDLDTPSRESRRRRPPSRRRTRYRSAESTENLFSQQFSQMINLVRQNQLTISGLEDLPVEGDPGSRLLQRTSSRTTPRGSRRWRRVLMLSDTESDGFDNADSLYADSESNVSLGRHRVFHGESDAISYSTYGGDSDASVDLHGFLDSEMYTQPNEGSEFESDTDIDPMHAGLNHWNSDDLGGEGEAEDVEGEEEYGEWEEVDGGEDVVQSTDARSRVQNFLFPSQSGQRAHSPEPEHTGHWEIRESRLTYTSNVFANSEPLWVPDVREPTDYLDERGLEEFLQHLAEDDNSRRGAPPAAVSFVNSLPRVVITEEHEKHDGLTCAICKDLLGIGTVVNRLPCNHLYHPSCILPWLSSRNSCPLCRYELPTDDKEYEERKRNIRTRVEIRNLHQNVTEDSSSSFSDGAEEEEPEFSEGRLEQRELRGVEPAVNGSGRGRWFFLAAAPIVGLVGIVLVLWLGNLGTERTGSSTVLPQQGQQNLQITGSSSNRREHRSRRWWSLF